jgi:hypothetical protein
MKIGNSLRARKDSMVAFILAATAAPTAGLLLAAPCGLACGGCPLGGACLAASPVVFGGVIIANAISSRRSRSIGGSPVADGDSEEESSRT